MLNNREIAIGFWLLVVLVWLLTKRELRHSFFNLVKAFFKWKLLSPLIGLFVYIGILTMVLAKIGFWQWDQAKDTVLWTLGSAGVFLFRSNDAGDEEKFFSKIIYENIGFAAILEFIINFYTFPLWVEIFFVPFVAILVVIETYTGLQHEEDMKKIQRFVTGLLVFIGGVVLFFTIKKFINHWYSLVNTRILFDYLLPFVFTIGVIPYIYIFALLIEYEILFVRVDFFTMEKALSRYIKLRIFLSCNFHLYKLHRFAKSIGIIQFSSKSEAAHRIKKLCK